MEISARGIEREWGIANAEGSTTAVCKDSDTPEQAARRLGLRHIRSISSHNGGIVAGMTQHGRLLAIGHSYGPMACYIDGIGEEWCRPGTLIADNT